MYFDSCRAVLDNTLTVFGRPMKSLEHHNYSLWSELSSLPDHKSHTFSKESRNKSHYSYGRYGKSIGEQKTMRNVLT